MRTLPGSHNPQKKYLRIHLYPSGSNTIVSVTTDFAHLLKDEAWEPETISGSVNASGGISATRHGGYQKSSAQFDTCFTTGAIESLILKSFPDLVAVNPVKSLSLGDLYQVYYDQLLIGNPKGLAEQAMQIASATKLMRSKWEEEVQNGEGTNRNDTATIKNTAAIKLGIAYAMGYGGPKDESKAVKWFRKAATDEGIAQYNLGIMYLKGLGVVKDEAEAAEWFLNASLNCETCIRAKIILALCMPMVWRSKR